MHEQKGLALPADVLEKYMYLVISMLSIVVSVVVLVKEYVFLWPPAKQQMVD